MSVLLVERAAPTNGGTTVVLTMNRPGALSAPPLGLEGALKDAFRALAVEAGMRAAVQGRGRALARPGRT